MRTKIVALLLGVFLLASLAACSTTAAAQTDNDDAAMRTVTVNGTGRVTLSPDLARISIGVFTEGPDAAEAVNENNEQAQAVVDTLVDLGVSEDDIRTTEFSIFPRRDFDEEGEPREITYEVRNTVFVTVRDLEMIGQVLNAVVEAGANNITGIQFDLDDRSAAESDALQAAVADARSRAEALAEAADVELGAVQSINTMVSGGVPQPFFARGALEEAAAEVPVSPGQMEISVQVTVVYELQ